MTTNRLGHVVVGLFIAVIGFSAHAINIPKNKTIDAIRVFEHYAVIVFSPPVADIFETVGCGSMTVLDVVVLEFENTSNLYDGKEQYSTLLATYMAGKAVGFGVSGCRIGSGNNHPLIYRVDI